MKLINFLALAALFETSKGEIQCSRNSKGFISCHEGVSLLDLLNEDT